MNKINGIDVSECEHHYTNPVNGTIYHGCAIYEQINELGYSQDTLCEQNPDCYFKRFKRLQEENDELKEKCKKYGEINEKETMHYAILTNENKKLTKICQEFKDRYCELYENADQLTNKTYKYKQALEEIREKLKKYDANIGDTIIANPIQDCYDTYKLIDEVFK